MPVLLDPSGRCRRLDVFAVPFVTGAASDLSEHKVGEDVQFCSSLLLLTQSFTFMEAKLSKASLGRPALPWLL